MTAHEFIRYAAAFLLGVVAVGRAVRLVVADDWPPVSWVRNRWELATAYRNNEGEPLRDSKGDLVPGPWTKLLTCPFCFAPYAAAVDLGWGALTRVDPGTGWGLAWWLVNLWAAVSYLSAILVVRDEPVD